MIGHFLTIQPNLFTIDKTIEYRARRMAGRSYREWWRDWPDEARQPAEPIHVRAGAKSDLIPE
jgi:hypothetical protein